MIIDYMRLQNFCKPDYNSDYNPSFYTKSSLVSFLHSFHCFLFLSKILLKFQIGL